ncbi:hypothetical protein O3Q52_49360, partial [Streptomyces sp. ActVer]|nr:hypothetical protein [Streptomyces sp. ActVer]
MRVRVATSVLGITAALLTVSACSTDTTGAKHATAATARTGSPADTTQAAPLTSAALETRLLDQRDLGSGYLRNPGRPAHHDGVTVIGCPALGGLGGGAAPGA